MIIKKSIAKERKHAFTIDNDKMLFFLKKSIAIVNRFVYTIKRSFTYAKVMPHCFGSVFSSYFSTYQVRFLGY